MAEQKENGGGTKKKQPCLEVRSATEGFRRAGRAWGKAPTVVPVSELTKEQIAALKAEPNLVVAEVGA